MAFILVYYFVYFTIGQPVAQLGMSTLYIVYTYETGQVLNTLHRSRCRIARESLLESPIILRF